MFVSDTYLSPLEDDYESKDVEEDEYGDEEESEDEEQAYEEDEDTQNNVIATKLLREIRRTRNQEEATGEEMEEDIPDIDIPEGFPENPVVLSDEDTLEVEEEYTLDVEEYVEEVETLPPTQERSHMLALQRETSQQMSTILQIVIDNYNNNNSNTDDSNNTNDPENNQ